MPPMRSPASRKASCIIRNKASLSASRGSIVEDEPLRCAVASSGFDCFSTKMEKEQRILIFLLSIRPASIVDFVDRVEKEKLLHVVIALEHRCRERGLG